MQGGGSAARKGCGQVNARDSGVCTAGSESSINVSDQDVKCTVACWLMLRRSTRRLGKLCALRSRRSPAVRALLSSITQHFSCYTWSYWSMYNVCVVVQGLCTTHNYVASHRSKVSVCTLRRFSTYKLVPSTSHKKQSSSLTTFSIARPGAWHENKITRKWSAVASADILEFRPPIWLRQTQSALWDRSLG